MITHWNAAVDVAGLTTRHQQNQRWNIKQKKNAERQAVHARAGNGVAGHVILADSDPG